jgi:hypothetical protein
VFCPPLGWDDLLLEAAKAWGYPTLAAWQNESTYNKGIVLGHFLWMQRRDGYESDRQRDHAKNKRPDADAPKRPHAAFRYGGEMLRARLEAQRGEG